MRKDRWFLTKTVLLALAIFVAAGCGQDWLKEEAHEYLEQTRLPMLYRWICGREDDWTVWDAYHLCLWVHQNVLVTASGGRIVPMHGDVFGPCDR